MQRVDRIIGTTTGLCALRIYAVALAPDLLYGDSGEFQTLIYAWGVTQPSG